MKVSRYMGSFTFKLEDGEPSSTNSSCHKAKTVILRLFHSSSITTLTAYKLLSVVECDQNKLLFNSSGRGIQNTKWMKALFCFVRGDFLFFSLFGQPCTVSQSAFYTMTSTQIFFQTWWKIGHPLTWQQLTIYQDKIAGGLRKVHLINKVLLSQTDLPFRWYKYIPRPSHLRPGSTLSLSPFHCYLPGAVLTPKILWLHCSVTDTRSLKTADLFSPPCRVN